MKKYIFILSMTLFFIACGGNNDAKKSQPEESTVSLEQFSFKVEGLNDTIITDSIFKMIFTVEGIDQMYIKTNESEIVITADKSMVDAEMLAKEITSRGGIILNE